MEVKQETPDPEPILTRIKFNAVAEFHARWRLLLWKLTGHLSPARAEQG